MESRAPSKDEVRSSLHIDIDTRMKLLPDELRMHKVSPQLRMKKGQYSDEPSAYDPISVSLGPYHHGKEEFRRAEEFKYICLDWCANGDNEQKDFLFDEVSFMIKRVRDCYGDVDILNKYDDNALARMMLLDACFIIYFTCSRVSDIVAKDFYKCLGVAAALPFAARDILVLENQIPLFVLELILLRVAHGPDSTARLVEVFMIKMMSVDDPQYDIISLESTNRPLHFLEACRRVLVQKPKSIGNQDERHLQEHTVPVERLELMTQPDRCIKNRMTDSKGNSCGNESKESIPNNYITCQSVSYLKTKGIYCQPSFSHFLEDIHFTSHAFSGELRLPICYASNLTSVFLSNMIAYEIAPGNVAHSSDHLTVLSYVSLMKSLIQTPDDVIELQKQGILRLNRFANYEQVVHIFKSIETFHLRNVNIYQDVMCRVGQHCSSNCKTWMADLIHQKFKNPWTTTALASATILLVLTFLQTVFTIRPR